MKGTQLALFDERRGKGPGWEDVQKGRARAVSHGMYATPCKPSCMWADSAFSRMGETVCYLFGEPVAGGMCPSTTHLEWLP